MKQTHVWSQEIASGITCDASENFDECVVGPRASALLQVDHSAKKTEFDRRHIQDPDSSSVTVDQMLQHTKPLKSQIADLRDRVASLEATAEQHGSEGKQDEEYENNADNNVDEEYENNDAKGDADNWAWDDDRKETADKTTQPKWRKEAADNTEEESSGKRRKLNEEGYEETQPDWNGVAPKAWNGLEKVNAKDKGRKASWKGKGTGVASGRKYTGEYPYEIMMDVDVIVDSNPSKSQPAVKKEEKTETKPGGKQKKEDESGEEESAPKQEGKSAPKHGGKKEIKAPKTPAKSGPRHGGKSSKREAGEAKDDAAPKTQAKSGPKQAGKAPVGEGGKNEEAPAKSGPKPAGKAPVGEGGKNEESTQALLSKAERSTLATKKFEERQTHGSQSVKKKKLSQRPIS